MKGIVFKYLEDFVVENHGNGTWNTLIENTPLETEGGVFVAPGNYPDEDLFALVTEACARLNVKADDLLLVFGEYMLDRFSQDYAKFFDRVSGAKEFLQSIHCVIHVEVKKLWNDAQVPDFFYDDPDQQGLVMHYHSPRKLCVLLRGLIKGVSKYFKEEIAINETDCVHHGHDHCRFELTFS